LLGGTAGCCSSRGASSGEPARSPSRQTLWMDPTTNECS
jgi:hypothetical protein